MLGGDKGVNRIAAPQRILDLRNSGAFDAGKRLPRISATKVLRMGQAFTSLDDLRHCGLVIRIAGKMTAEQLEEIGNAVAIAIFFGDELQSGRDVRRLALLFQLAFHRFESSAERIMWFSFGSGVGSRLVRQVASSTIVQFFGQERSKVVEQRSLVRGSGESGRSISRP